MTASHFRWSAVARVAEVGFAGTVTPARLVDWMQEAAACHCQAAGWSIDRLRREGAVWIVRSLILELEAPVRFGDPVEVETWVSDLRFFRTHREYVVYAQDRVAARAQADWIFLRERPGGRLRPSRPPEAMKDAFPFDPVSALDVDDAPDAPEPSVEADVAPLELRVRPSDLDENEHVNHAVYLEWIEDHAHLAGWGPLRRARLEFESDATLGDTVRVAATPRAGHWDVRIARGDLTLVRAAVDRGAAPGRSRPAGSA